MSLVVTDTGPLISLAVIDRLDLLDSFDRPVLVADVVMYECTKMQDKPGAGRLRDWFMTFDRYSWSGRASHILIETQIGKTAEKDRRKNNALIHDLPENCVF